MKSIVFSFILFISLVFFWLIFFRDQSNLPLSRSINKDIDKIVEQKPKPEDTAKNILDAAREKYFRADGMIESEKNKTTSESQSYGMLIAVLSGDRELFDRVLNWTKNNLQIRPNDKLFSWLWQNGKVVDPNPATDADQDIAYALYLAHKKWGNEEYLNEAAEIVRDIWKVETKEIKGVRYVGAGNWAVNDTSGIIINPSYLAPYQYRIFAQIDSEHNWIQLVDSSYKTLELCTGLAGLAQDWCKINNQGNAVQNFKLSKSDSSVYSFDAMRVPYRIAMDYTLNSDPKALEYLKRNKVFVKDWKENGKIFAVYNQQGGYVGKNESLASYGAQLASMSLIDKEIAQEIFEKKIATIDFEKNISFYDMSWLWFGLHFYTDVMKKYYEPTYHTSRGGRGRGCNRRGRKFYLNFTQKGASGFEFSE